MLDHVIPGEKVLHLFEYLQFLEDRYIADRDKVYKTLSPQYEDCIDRDLSYELFVGMSEAVTTIGLNDKYIEWKRFKK